MFPSWPNHRRLRLLYRRRNPYATNVGYQLTAVDTHHMITLRVWARAEGDARDDGVTSAFLFVP